MQHNFLDGSQLERLSDVPRIEKYQIPRQRGRRLARFDGPNVMDITCLYGSIIYQFSHFEG